MGALGTEVLTHLRTEHASYTEVNIWRSTLKSGSVYDDMEEFICILGEAENEQEIMSP